jgi:hypothetical protein
MFGSKCEISVRTRNVNLDLSTWRVDTQGGVSSAQKPLR